MHGAGPRKRKRDHEEERRERCPQRQRGPAHARERTTARAVYTGLATRKVQICSVSRLHASESAASVPDLCVPGPSGAPVASDIRAA
jgi:hypothetical protein